MAFIDDVLDADDVYDPPFAVLAPEAEQRLRYDGRGLEGDAQRLVFALHEIRQGAWDSWRTDPADPEDAPGAVQRSAMEDALHAADRLAARAEALRAHALHGLRVHHGLSHGRIAEVLGVPRSTASDRWRALERKRPELWDWARGTEPAADSGECDGTSVGAVVTDTDGRILAAERNKPPVGLVPGAAGHGDSHGGPAQAVRAELGEEVGVGPDGPGPRLLHLEEVAGGWRANRCRRPLADGRQPGHHWTIYRAVVEPGEAVVAADEVASWRWVEPLEAQRLADRTAAWAKGAVSDAEFAASPGWEPVWVWWLNVLGLVVVEEADLERIEALAEQAPTAG